MLARSVAPLTSGGRVWDVCIVGAGPAGITLSRRLGERGLSVALLEAGPEHYSAESQSFYEAEVIGQLKFRPDLSRLRCFGGTSNHWGGWSRPLDPADFGTKVQGVDTAWPISRADLEPYLGEVDQILELPALRTDSPLGDGFRTARVRYSPPVNFGTKYRGWLESSREVAVALGSSVTDFREIAPGHVVVDVMDLERRTHTLRARRLVLCAGGIENSRLLLWMHERHPGKVVREPAALGRYWMEHPHFTIGDVLLEEPVAQFDFDTKGIAWVSPTPEMQRELGVLNCALRLVRREREEVEQLLIDLACSAPALAERIARRFRKRLVCGALLRASWEQSPRPWNRIVLSRRRDPFGVPRAEIHWRLSELERTTVLKTAEAFGEQLARTGLGRVRIDPWLVGGMGFPADDQITGNHHMGGTRMGRDPRTSVVDPDCRLHGTAGIYVCGSSVFPSAGHANPTFTIVQLALRLSDHLIGRTSNLGVHAIRTARVAA